MRVLGLQSLAAAIYLTAAAAECPPQISSSRGRYHVTAKNVTEATPYMQEEGRKRAPYYLKKARLVFQEALALKKANDKSKGSWSMKLLDAQNQVLGALDNDPDTADIWLDAGKATLQFAEIKDTEAEVNHALEISLSLFAKGLRLQPQTMTALLKWLRVQKPKKEEWVNGKLAPCPVKFRTMVVGTIEAWQKGSVPDLPIKIYPEIPAPDTSGDDATCAADAGSDDSRIAAHLASFEQKTLFPTHVTLSNINAFVPDGFCDRLADMAISEYARFGDKKKAEGGGKEIDPNDLNDAFFRHQTTDEKGLDSKKGRANWPEMYNSADFKLLRKVTKAGAYAFAHKMGLMPPEMKEVTTSLWAAVYPGSGGRHGYHSHQSSLVSCVLYCRTPGSKAGPILFADPRGSIPMDDYERHTNERDYEPPAPFHRSEYFFPEKGDMVCFPSWLIHNIPSHHEKEWRVAFPINIQYNHGMDSFLRTAELH